MEETPISVMEKQIKFYKEFITRVETRDGMVDTEHPNDDVASQKKFDGIIFKLRNKVQKFEKAIVILKKNESKWDTDMIDATDKK